MQDKKIQQKLHSSSSMHEPAMITMAMTATTIARLLIHLLRSTSDLASVAAAHAKLLKLGVSSAISSSNHLLAGYCRCGAPACAHDLFNETPHMDVVSWTSLMSGYANAGHPDMAIALFRTMARTGVLPNAFTFSIAVSVCAHLANVGLGRQVHAYAKVSGYAHDIVVATALVNMYGKGGSIQDARMVFDGTVGLEGNIVLWGSMLSAYAQNALGHEAIGLFAKFQSKGHGMVPNHFMLSSIVNACASVGRLSVGKCMHTAVLRLGHERNDVIAAALVDMYSKCSCYEYSKKVFDKIEQPSVIPYTSTIVAAAKYGLGECAIALFDQMIDRGVQPNSVTLLGVMHACSHSGLVDVGLELFHSMRCRHGIDPCVSHYTCAVDMLGRAGRLDEAFKLANEAQGESRDEHILWSSLLSACRTHNCLDLAIGASQRVSKLSQDMAGVLVAMSNAYVSAGQADNAAAIWSDMERRGIRKDPGCSWIEIKDIYYVFYAGVVLPAGPRAGDVMVLLDDLESKMREKGYKGRLGSERIIGDHEEEEKGVMVGVHSEMLALGFGLLVVPKGMAIRVMKNLRMCCDCHEAFKIISGIVEREFIVRDVNRFHHFKLGSCSCKDYW